MNTLRCLPPDGRHVRREAICNVHVGEFAGKSYPRGTSSNAICLFFADALAERDREGQNWNVIGYGDRLVSPPLPLMEGTHRMSVHRRIQTSDVSGVTVVAFVDHKILDAANILELGDELFALIEEDGHKKILLNFHNVEFLSSAALNKLIILDKKVKENGGMLKFCNLRPEIQEVFVITRLHQLFEIKKTIESAVASF
jgi:anti-sigma B factor antagonist